MSSATVEERLGQAQKLYWEIHAPNVQWSPEERAELFARLAALYQDVGMERLIEGDTRGWLDLYHALTAWADAGDRNAFRRLYEECERHARMVKVGRNTVEAMLTRLKSYANSLAKTVAHEPTPTSGVSIHPPAHPEFTISGTDYLPPELTIDWSVLREP